VRADCGASTGDLQAREVAKLSSVASPSDASGGMRADPEAQTGDRGAEQESALEQWLWSDPGVRELSEQEYLAATFKVIEAE